jgi:hypothetical protein
MTIIPIPDPKAIPIPVIYCAGRVVVGHARTVAGAKLVMASKLAHVRTPREIWTARLVEWDSSISGPLIDGVEINGKAWACGVRLAEYPTIRYHGGHDKPHR